MIAFSYNLHLASVCNACDGEHLVRRGLETGRGKGCMRTMMRGRGGLEEGRRMGVVRGELWGVAGEELDSSRVSRRGLGWGAEGGVDTEMYHYEDRVVSEREGEEGHGVIYMAVWLFCWVLVLDGGIVGSDGVVSLGLMDVNLWPWVGGDRARRVWFTD
ncbi:hypothetical protein Tco_1420591 [Tanacetum coccineum]